MDIYTDYANWKFENHEFIHNLVERKSVTISRFTSVIVVVDYLYDKYTKKNKNEQKFSTNVKHSISQIKSHLISSKI